MPAVGLPAHTLDRRQIRFGGRAVFAINSAPSVPRPKESGDRRRAPTCKPAAPGGRSVSVPNEGGPDDRSTVSRHPRLPAMPSRHDSRPEPAVLVLLALCVPASLAWAPGPVVQCEPCDKRAVAQCEQPLDCEPVKEHGCGCCFTCALARGHACGIYTERCGSGLRCSPRADEARPLQALLEGRGECQLQQRLTEPTEKAAEAEAEISDTSEEPDPSSLWVRPSVGSGPRNPRFFVVNEPHTTAESWKAVEEPPCKQRMDRLMRQMKDNPILNIRRLHLPNCDRRGYFKKRQCKPSKGRKRGLCWCVNKLGMRIPDSEHIGGKRKCQNID